MIDDKRISQRRPNYVNGELLDEADFKAEQSYHVDGQRRHRQTLHTPGVSSGLEVSRQSGRVVQISPGVAIDSRGREIQLKEAVSLTVSQGAPKESAYVTIRYDEAPEQSDDSERSRSEADSPRGENLRIVEYAVLRVDTAPPTPDGLGILLARVPFDSKGDLAEPDLSSRLEAGARLATDSVGTREIARASVTAEKLHPSLRGGWQRLLFKPSPFDDPNVKSFKIGATRTFADESGAKGTMTIPMPPGVTMLKSILIAGQMNQEGIDAIVYRCGWNRKAGARDETELAVTIPPPTSMTQPFEKTIDLNWSIDPMTHAVALYVYARGAAEINLVAAQVE